MYDWVPFALAHRVGRASTTSMRKGALPFTAGISPSFTHKVAIEWEQK